MWNAYTTDVLINWNLLIIHYLNLPSYKTCDGFNIRAGHCSKRALTYN